MNNKAFRPIQIIITVLIFSVCDLIVTTLFQDILRVPFFFDTIFMIATLFLLGPIAAICEYLLFITLVCIKLFILFGTFYFVYLYTISALTIIFVTWLFIRKNENLQKGVNTTFLYILTASILAGLACAVVSGLISTLSVNLDQKKWIFDQIIYAFYGEQFNYLASAVLGRIPVTILDRIITTFAGYGVFKLYNHFFSKTKRH